ncbi:LOW QUALITY PROTEIN: Pol Polyprotein [Phytophthora megakarya]|uniref:Pol Polyprotein n=1 Tax=Phytophthora megakarya TaxID=4795 RepID=A0A225W656_9STRA|nr:LOW QUALITY PROTEIN: Pol Polyprotein [Phytophthora megakarya]
MEEVYVADSKPECVMHGLVLREHYQNDKMIHKFTRHRIIVPNSLRADLMDWYHQNLCHPGGIRQYKTMHQIFYWPSMATTITEFCDKCQTCKHPKIHGGKQGYGKLPPRTLKTVEPFEIVHIDLIGSYNDDGYGMTKLLSARHALTTADTFDREWLCRYPRPRKVVYDNGGEFIGEEFQELLRSYGIKKKPITTKNPQANAICERVYLVLLNIIPFAVRASYHTIFNASPDQVLFGQDMMSRQLYDANLSYLFKRRFDAILADNDRENDKRLEHFYQPGDQVMVRVPQQITRSVEWAVYHPSYPYKPRFNDSGSASAAYSRVCPTASWRSMTDAGLASKVRQEPGGGGQ